VPAKTKKTPPTTSELRERLAAKYPLPEWVLLNEVRDSTGWEGNRTADCLAMATWPSRGCSLYGFEIKASRTDVLKELKSPQKADGVKKFCDRWYLVLSNSDLIKASEVPKAWGLIVPHGTGLKISKEAPASKPKRWPREFVASMLRNSAQSQSAAKAKELEKSRADGEASGREWNKYRAEELESQLKRLEGKVKAFEEASGVTVLSERYAWDGKVREEAHQLRAVMASGAGHYFEVMSNLVRQIETASASVREKLVKAGTLDPKPKLSDPCPHPARHGRHELYVDADLARKKGRKKTDPLPEFCRACGAREEIS